MGLRHFAVAAAAAATITACSASASSPATRANADGPSYYLALGDSLSQGIQPDAAGTDIPTSQGYPDQLYATLRVTHPGLRLVKLGCPGETTSTMMHGGICSYPGGSQLAAAIAFLHAHRGRVSLVTIDIGANDPNGCASQPNLASAAACVRAAVPTAVTNLTGIMARLRAAGPGARFAGMSYYLPELAQWRNGPGGRTIAQVAEPLAASYNTLLERVYAKSGTPVANVFGAFRTADFTGQTTLPGIGTVPRNVALVCRWTWECAASPRGPNEHANQAGYAVIARAFLSAAGLS